MTDLIEQRKQDPKCPHRIVDKDNKDLAEAKTSEAWNPASGEAQLLVGTGASLYDTCGITQEQVLRVRGQVKVGLCFLHRLPSPCPFILQGSYRQSSSFNPQHKGQGM